MTRRCLLFSAIAPALRGGAAEEVWDALTAAIAALTESNAVRFLAAFDPSMPRFAAVRADVEALLASAEVQSSADLIDSSGDSAKRSLELDWLLQITPRDAPPHAVHRKERVKCRFEKQGKRWRIVSFEPIQFFALPKF